ncbi:Uncharacterised protein [Actinomyces howellii]|uniref:Uncharacterized protein n=1 Tax=Actinomyces howellii TaxID=52771 RepID=A0A3S4SNW3_9ACTO|nr:Uncharacterised protein [Actinomyces howellii]
MMIRARSRIFLFLILLGTAAWLIVLTPCALAAYGKDSSSDASSSASTQADSDGGVQITVEATYTSSDGAAGSSATATSSTATTTVLPVCGYRQSMSGAGMVEHLSRPDVIQVQSTTSENWAEDYPGYETHAGDHAGYWYEPWCWSERAPDLSPTDFRTMSQAFESANSPVYVPAGSAPPTPTIDGRTLAQAAWDAVTIPAPTIAYNPTLGDAGSTLVGWYTWIWATTDTPSHVTATATAGPVTATVTATASGLDLSGPDTEIDCTGFGTPWSRDATGTDCTVVFTRSSAHLGGTTPLTTSISYTVAFTATDGSTGNLGNATTTSTTHIPVAEVQTLNTTDD